MEEEEGKVDCGKIRDAVTTSQFMGRVGDNLGSGIICFA
jgi:hypothetical protein